LKKRSYKFSKTKWIIFASVCVLVLASLPFSSWIERKIYDTVGADVYYNYQTALSQECVVHILNVGSADCIILELPDGTKGIIDSGSCYTTSREHIIDYIQEYIFEAETGVFDFMILTHSDADHIGGVSQILDAFQVNKIYRPTIFYYKSGTSDSEELAMNESELTRAKSEDFIDESATSFPSATITTEKTATYFNCITSIYEEPNCSVEYTSEDIIIQDEEADYEMRFYSPYKLKYADANDYSPVIILSYNNHSIALVGDAQEEVETYLVENYDLPQVDALKVGHHGDEDSSTTAFLSELSPTYAFISVSSNDSHGNPDEVTLQRLQDSGISENHILQTGLNGDILFAIGEAGIYVSASGSLTVEFFEWWFICVVIIGTTATLLFVINNKSQKKNKVKLK